MKHREKSGQKGEERWALSSTIFYQIQHTCDFTLGQGYSTWQKIEMSSQKCHPGDAVWWFLENKRGKCSAVLYRGLLSLWSAMGAMGAMSLGVVCYVCYGLTWENNWHCWCCFPLTEVSFHGAMSTVCIMDKSSDLVSMRSISLSKTITTMFCLACKSEYSRHSHKPYPLGRQPKVWVIGVYGIRGLF